MGFAAICLGRAPTREDASLVTAIALAPIVWVNVIFGQMGLLLALLFVGALRILPARPVLAGALMGVLTIKPQLGLLLPLVLLLSGAWRAIAAAAATALALAAASIVLFGMEPWRLYVAETMPLQWKFVTQMDGFYANQMITPYAALRSLGMPFQAALVAHATIAAFIAATTFTTLRSSASWPLKCAVVAFASVLMVPYVLAYDLAIPLATLVWHLVDNEPRPYPGLALAGGLWALPYALTIMLQLNGIPLLPVVLVATFFWLAGDALGWRPFVHVKSAFASIRA